MKTEQSTSPAKPKLKRVAIWLQLEPGQELIGEGIGMHLARLLRGMRDRQSAHAVICAPTWSKSKVEEWLRMYDIRNSVSTAYFGPIIPTKIARGAPLGPKVPDKLSGEITWYFSRLLSNVNPIFLLPFMALAGLVYAFARPFRMLAGATLGLARRVVNGGRVRYLALARRQTYEAMAYHIDHRDGIEACIVPIGNWRLCQLIKTKPITVQIPDIVFLEFPEVFDGNRDVPEATSSILKVANHATRIICPSPYVSELHHQHLGVPARKSKVVYHAPMIADQYLEPFREPGETVRQAGARLAERFMLDTNFGSHFERYLPPYPSVAQIKRFSSGLRSTGVIVNTDTSLDRFGGSIRWLTAVSDNWANRDALLYFPTQNRPYKNILRTLLAIDALRAQGRNVVLMLTGDLNASPEILQLIADRDLYGHVLCLPRMSAVLHAAMYALADLAIAPSLFEGGFPFLFSEGMSVGTPIVMADIPVTRDVLPSSLWPATLFDPRDITSITTAIKRGIDQSADLVAIQKPFFDAQVAARDWGDVAQEYLDACDEGLLELKLRKKTGDRQSRISAELQRQVHADGFVSPEKIHFTDGDQ